MHQLTQNLKDGFMQVLEVPFPALAANQVLVRNHYSVISAGTEGKTVRDARLGYLAKARARQKEVKQVIELAQSQGIGTTYKIVMNKLQAPAALGYSSAGEVIDVGTDIRHLKIGDYVACGGVGAAHAEVVAIAKNLCAPVPEGVELKYAAFATIAAIAMQGMRQADLRLGENCVIIGLGLVGQLTLQLLNAGGIQTIGIDIDSKQVQLARQCGAHIALERNRPDLEQVVSDFTSGHGADAVIITAGTSSLDPVALAGSLCRKKGKVVIVGVVPTGFSRKDYYRKELDLRMSCSYGPGRYDADYEDKGIDYPFAYVRWTENRNMQAFLELLKYKKLNIEPLISHVFKFDQAPAAYDLILAKKESYVGILLEYDVRKELPERVDLNGKFQPSPDVNVGIIGAGSFAQNFLLPNVAKSARLVAVATAHGNNARNIAEKYHCQYATGAAGDILNDKNINTVFIATRHNLHASFVLQAMQSGKHVFVEKPLALTAPELEDLRTEYSKSKSQNQKAKIVMVGFNRRFAPHIQKVKALFPGNVPCAINYRINAGTVPPEHWLQDKDIGGGRIIGEVCHFVDLAMFIAGADITTVSANVMASPQHLLDTLVLNLGFANGSVAAISYFSNGSKAVAKEHLEIFYANQVASIDDFKEMTVFGHKKTRYKLANQDKGHHQEVAAFINAIRTGLASPIPFEQSYWVTLATFKIIESIQTGRMIHLNRD